MLKDTVCAGATPPEEGRVSAALGQAKNELVVRTRSHTFIGHLLGTTRPSAPCININL
jgi:hypothetical protein